jgi:hypothetical protein
MSIANPWALALLSLIPLIVYLHSLMMQRRDMRVSAIFLWDETLKELGNRPGPRRLNLNVFLWLQIAAVAALSMGLAGPHLAGTGITARRVLLIMDVSASMRAVEGGVERFAMAKKEAHALIRKLPPGGEMMVLEAGANTTVRSNLTGNRESLHQLIDVMRATDEPGRLDRALNQGAAFATEGGAVYLFTDGAGISGLNLKGAGVTVKPVLFGSGGRNLGITRMALQRKRDGSGNHQLFLRVNNFTGERVETGLSLQLNRRTIDERNLALDPNSEMDLIFPFPELEPGEMTASLDITDDLPLDNVAYAVLQPSAAIRVLLVSRGNFFLENALSAHPGIRVTRTARVNERLLARLMRENDVAVFDGIPAPRLPGGAYLILGSPVMEPAFRVKGFTGAAEAEPLLPGHPLLEHLQGARFRVNKVFSTQTPEGGELLMGSGSSPMIYAYAAPELRLVYLGFRLQDSDLPLTPAFPILLGNIMKWLRPTAFAGGAKSALTGHSYEADYGPQSKEALIEGPGGKSAVPLRDGRLIFRDVRVAGFYEIRAGERQQRFAANLFDERESDIAAGKEDPISELLESSEREEKRKALNPAWRYFLLLALGSVALESLLLNWKS